ncbi:hypothetical protein [Mycoplasmopsis primatum]|uniref:hypothetical protein n=1 Tax=Mycoplasmopsis primatum TaxID=55604 RepID=UPI00049507C3|nr:hypothetical protein [Mycoplasmopsis primatum]
MGTLNHSSNDARNALIILISILTISIIAISVFLGFYFRSKKIKHIKNKIESMKKEISNISNNRSMTIARFESVAESKSDYKKDLEALLAIDRKMQTIYDTAFTLYNRLVSNLSKFSSNELKPTFRKFEHCYNDYLNKHSQFKAISNTLNTHWNIIDNLSSDSTKILNELEKYIKKNKSKMQHSYEVISHELDLLKKETYNFEDKKINDEITNVSAEINEHERKINSFAKKVDNIVALEKAIFKTLPEILDVAYNSAYQKESIANLKTRVATLQTDFNTMPYQTQLENVRKIYSSYFAAINFTKVVHELNTFLRKEFDKIETIYKRTNQQISLFFGWIEENINNTKDASDFRLHKNLYDTSMLDFENIKQWIKQNQDMGFLEIQNFFEQYRTVINYLNNKLSEYNLQQARKLYNEFYFSINNVWFYKVLTLRNLIESSSNNDLEFKRLVELNLKINDDYKKNQNIDLKSDLWLSWNDSLIGLYKKVYPQYIYKQMVEILLQKISPKRNNNTAEINEIMLYVNQNIVALKYKEAFEILAISVQENKF